mmetsp:Transcript_113265/g.283699  ORF Transcript_113265/g.283699 Transcript_113265/m.283699 type:complete len:823 (+) Transcript_113265:57-2525(+)|eukprot:CAMPEP_0115285596 /NCGR_PEP_ID=MMETSP0270-20121206/61512_1 /TAXON_ID=71861 /ORGANISM="Scrippsiella trochoidea, Strain CCMP3099" /LENGTH=822 /DNA_ID=CAMNT_0002702623 /DNA_START=50 /DNA_END=2518 /DNA_ORIENTATION=-
MASHSSPPPQVGAETRGDTSLDGWTLEGGSEVPATSLGSLRTEFALEFPDVPVDPARLQAVLSVVAPSAGTTSRAPLCLVAVLDKSGSMHGMKLELVTKALFFMLDYLSECDSLGIVVFDSNVSVLAPLTMCSAEGRACLATALGGVNAGTTTNLSGGLLRGLELHSEGVGQTAADHAVRSTFLFTDGLANAGIMDPEAICSAATNILSGAGKQKSTLSTFGFGRDHSAYLLQALARTGEGSYSYIENEESIGSAFGQAFGGLLTTTHQNARLYLEMAPGVEIPEISTAYRVEVTTDTSGASSATVELGDLYGEERRDILVTLALPQAIVEEQQFLGYLHASGFSVRSLCTEATEKMSLTIQRCSPGAPRDGAAGERRSHEQVERQRNRCLAVRALDGARAAAHARDLPQARKLLRDAISVFEASWLLRAGDDTLAGLLRDLKACLDNMDHEVLFEDVGSKTISIMLGAHERQRACFGLDSTAQYANESMLDIEASISHSLRSIVLVDSHSQSSSRGHWQICQSNVYEACWEEKFELKGDSSVPSGSIGSGQLALDRKSGDFVTVKLFNVTAMPYGQQDRMLGEINKMKSQASCAHLVRWFDCWCDRQRGFVGASIEYMDYGTAADLQKHLGGGGMPSMHLQYLVHQALHGLHHLHSKHITHKSCELENILINTRGEVKLIGFGDLASMVAGDEFCRTLTHNDFQAMRSVSPERLLGESYDEKSDIWAFGMVVVELATGCHPFANFVSFPQLYVFVCEDPEPRLDPSSYALALCDFTAECLVREPQKRTDSAGLLAHRFLSEATCSVADFASWLSSLSPASA